MKIFSDIQQWIAIKRGKQEEDFYIVIPDYRYGDPQGFYALVTKTIPARLRSAIGLKEFKPNKRKRKFGRIKANFFNYVSIPLILTSIGVVYAVIGSFSTLLPYFMTGIYLNGLIISLAIFALLKVYYNCYLLYQTARFLKMIEVVCYKDHITGDDIYNLRTVLEKRAELVNTKSMAETIDNIERFGVPNFSDNNARLIKSKLGYRASGNKAKVNFIAGLLVMLGLLGTFLGLLATIDAVGGALNSMSNLGSGGEIGVEEMGQFIGSLAGPLQGMGLAFSSSLFGLSGSLLIAFFIHLASTPQNAFIEDVSRWIDDRLAKFTPNLSEKDKVVTPKIKPTDDDLKEWLAGFVHMANKTNNNLSSLCMEVSRLASGTETAGQGIHQMVASQDKAILVGNAMNSNLENISGTSKVIMNSMSQIFEEARSTHGTIDKIRLGNETVVEINKEVSKKLEQISRANDNLAEGIHKSNQAIEEQIRRYSESSGQNYEMLSSIHNILAMVQETQLGAKELKTEASRIQALHLKQIENYVLQMGKMQKAHFDSETSQNKGLSKTLSMIGDTNIRLEKMQEALLNDVHVLLKRLLADPNIQRTESLVTQLNLLLKNLEGKIKSAFSDKKGNE